MERVKVGICGASGRMGRALIKAVSNNEQLELVAALEHSNNENVGKDVGEVANCGKLGIEIISDAEVFFSKSEGVIDFSFASSSIENIKMASKHNCSYVLGTTGFDKEQIKIIEEVAKSIPIVFSANMSIGVNIVLYYVEMMAKNLGDDYDAEIHEIHHRDKLDSPSGTALSIGKAIAKGRKIDLEKNTIKSRWGIENEREKGAIGFSTSRGGDVIGDHTVTFAGPGERVELSHKAGNREIFSNGALKALIWLKDRSPGYYTMANVLGLN